MASKLLKFLNSHDNWQELLAAAPYHITIKTDGERYLLKYNLGATDFSDGLALEARGHIVAQNAYGAWYFVARPFDKFFNFSEHFAATIDWSSVVIEEKVDGSLMKLYYWKGEWCVATNNSFVPSDSSILYYTMFWDLFNKEWLRELDPHYTYMFEMVGPRIQVVVPYDHNELVCLTMRNNLTGEEEPFFIEGLRRPAIYQLGHNLNDIVKYVALIEGEEGVVVRDVNYNRVKIKTEQYLRLHHTIHNGILTVKQCVEIIDAGLMDDFVAYNSDAKSTYLLQVYAALAHLVPDDFERQWLQLPIFDSRKAAAEYIKNNYPPLMGSYFFEMMDGKVKSATDFVSNLSIHNKTLLAKEYVGDDYFGNLSDLQSNGMG